MEKVRPWCGQPSDRGRLKNRNTHTRLTALWTTQVSRYQTCKTNLDFTRARDLFAIYVDDLISLLRRSGYGLYIGRLFIGCLLYADDIVLLSPSCFGLRKLANICEDFGNQWYIKFNPPSEKSAYDVWR